MANYTIPAIIGLLCAITIARSPEHYFGDRPRRAFGWKSLAFSYLKYADATQQGLNSIPKPNRRPTPNAKELQRTAASDSIRTAKPEGQRWNHCKPHPHLNSNPKVNAGITVSPIRTAKTAKVPAK